MGKYNRKAHGRRSLKKGIYLSEGVIRAFERNKKMPNKMIKIYDRSSTIVENFIGQTAHVYNGKVFVPVKINEDHVGHKFGEFSATRKQVKHPEKKTVVKGKK